MTGRCCRLLAPLLGMLGAMLIALWPATAAMQIATVQAPPYPIAQVLGFRQQDTDGDGQPDVAVLDAAFATAADRVTVVDGGGTMCWATEWQQAVDFEDDTWIFDPGATGRARLVIRFSRDAVGSGPMAELYDDQDGDGVVRYRIEGRRVVVTEGRYPTATVHLTIGTAWTRPDGLIDYNLQVSTDGVGEDRSKDGSAPPHDGKTDTLLLVSADPTTGAPLRQIERSYVQAPIDWGIPRAAVYANEGAPALPPTPYIFWVLLGNVGPAYEGASPTANPLIQMDWATGEIARVSIVMPELAPQRGWRISSHMALQDTGESIFDFENPFAYYDIAEDVRGYPSMIIRFSYSPPHAPTFRLGRFPSALTQVDYSWRQYGTDPHVQDFKVSLAGRNEIGTTVDVLGYRIRTLPYEIVPTWVAERTWDMATFVAREGQGYASTEGLYEWYPLEAGAGRPEDALSKPEIHYDYFTGVSSEPPVDQYQTITPGFRGEYSFNFGGTPVLYFSVIDRRLHLLTAGGGIWRLDDARAVRYASLDGQHINTWQREEHGQVVSSLWFVEDQLILADAEGVRLRHVETPQSLFDTGLPRNHADWLALGSALRAASGAVDASDPAAMFGQFVGPVERLAGASVRATRKTPEGFRLEIDLPTAGTGGPWLPPLAPGPYVATYRAGAGYAVQPRAPAHLQVLAISSPTDRGLVLYPTELAVTVRNDGDEDAVLARLRVVAVRDDGASPATAPVQMDVPASTTRTRHLVWVPHEPGIWRLKVEANGEELAGAAMSHAVEPAPRTDTWTLLEAQSVSTSAIALATAMAVAVVVLAGSVALTGVRSRPTRRIGDVRRTRREVSP